MQRDLNRFGVSGLVLMVVLLAQLWYRPAASAGIAYRVCALRPRRLVNYQPLERLAASQEDLAAQQVALLAALQTAQASGQTHIGVAAIGDGESHYGDGVVKPDVNFLLPAENAFFDPDKIGGVLRTSRGAPPGLNQILTSAADTSDANGRVNDVLAVRDSIDISKWRSSLATSIVANDDFTRFEVSIRPGLPGMCRT